MPVAAASAVLFSVFEFELSFGDRMSVLFCWGGGSVGRVRE